MSVPGKIQRYGHSGRQVARAGGCPELEQGTGGPGRRGPRHWPEAASLPPSPDPARLAWGVLPLGRPWLHLAPALPHKAPASVVPPPGAAPPCVPACPVAGVLVVDGGWAQAQPMSRPGWAACLHDSVRQAWAGVGRQWALSAAAFPQGGASLAAALPAREVPSLPPHYPMPGWEQLLPASPATGAPASRTPFVHAADA